MDKEKIIDIVKNVEDKSNKDLFLVVNELYTEHEKTKQLIINKIFCWFNLVLININNIRQTVKCIK